MSVDFDTMRLSEENYIRSGASGKFELLEAAGDALWHVVRQRADERNANRIIVVSGKGNNGGDGYILARKLYESRYDVYAISAAEPVTLECNTARELFRAALKGGRNQELNTIFGGLSARDRIETVSNAEHERIFKACNSDEQKLQQYFIEHVGDDAVVVDCMLGSGTKGELKGIYLRLAKLINESGAYVIACDIPTGLGSNGRTRYAIKADLTIAIGDTKTAYYLNDGKDYTGEILVSDIGIPIIGRQYSVTGRDSVSELFPKRLNNTHKGSYGTAVIVGCSDEYPGAGKLAALSALNTLGLTALRTGAGLVRLVVPDRMLTSMWGKARDCSIGYMSKLMTYTASAYAYGMGAGRGDAEILSLLIRSEKPLLIDADGLNLLAGNIGFLYEGPEEKEIILTPHLKEMSRLTGLTVEEIADNPIKAAEEFALKYRVTLLLKGSGSVITDGKSTIINAHGSPSLAKGGSGDILSGIITALTARGISALKACSAGAYILGEASYIAAEKYGEYSVTPTDVAAAIKRITILKQ